MNNDILLSPHDLMAMSDGVRRIIVDCRFDLNDTEKGRRDYTEGHLPGAFYAHLDEDLSGPIEAHSGRHPLPTPEAFAKYLS